MGCWSVDAVDAPAPLWQLCALLQILLSHPGGFLRLPSPPASGSKGASVWIKHPTIAAFAAMYLGTGDSSQPLPVQLDLTQVLAAAELWHHSFPFKHVRGRRGL